MKNGRVNTTQKTFERRNFQTQKIFQMDLSIEGYLALPKRKFQSLFGVCLNTFVILCAMVLETDPMIHRLHVMWTLHFLRTYNTQDNYAVFWNVNGKTFDDHIWQIIDIFSKLDLVSTSPMLLN